MIAANLRKYPQAMALQLCLPFGTRLIWHTKRPTTRLGRANRAAVARAFKAAGRIRYPAPVMTPQWFIDLRKRALALAKAVKMSMRSMF